MTKVFLISQKELMLEWDAEANKNLDPATLTTGSKKKVGWVCSVDPSHKWPARIHARTQPNPTGCPYCSGRLATASDNLESQNPEIAAEWHKEKNGELTPRMVKSSSNTEIWWKCSVAEDHEWTARPNDRTGKNQTGCPFCAGSRPSSTNNLGLIPHLKNEWHERNLPSKPEDFTVASGDKVWWQCPIAKDHEWPATISSRSGGRGCPFCAGTRPSKSYNLRVIYPELAAEWHQTKNADKKPEDFLPKSNKSVWWQCSRFSEHEWPATIASRAAGNGCPDCSPQTSAPEIRIFTELRVIFPNARSRIRIKNREADVLIEELKLIIEYDGEYYHRDKDASDKKKNRIFNRAGYNVLRIREKGLSKITKKDILTTSSELTKSDIDKILIWILENLKTPKSEEILRYLGENKFQNEKDFIKYLSYFPKPFPENSLKETHPELAAEWDMEKNSPLTPGDVSKGSRAQVWWTCPRNIKHKWPAKIKDRTSPARKTNCPICRKWKAPKSQILDTQTGQIYHRLQDVRDVLKEEGIERSLSQVNQYVLGTSGKKIGLDKRFNYVVRPLRS